MQIRIECVRPSSRTFYSNFIRNCLALRREQNCTLVLFRGASSRTYFDSQFEILRGKLSRINYKCTFIAGERMQREKFAENSDCFKCSLCGAECQVHARLFLARNPIFYFISSVVLAANFNLERFPRTNLVMN